MILTSNRLRWFAGWFIVFGLCMRVVPSLLDPAKPLTACDSWAYWEFAKSLAAGQGFTNHDALLADSCIPPLGPSHHYSPLLPMWEAAFILILGPNVWALAWSQIILSLLLVGGTFWATRDLFGRDAALLVTAAVSVEWSSVVYGSRLAHAENLVLLTFILTLWAILRSLRQESYIVWAGLFAGLGYLSKASMGWFFVIAGLGGLAWRLHHHGWKALRNRWYLLAIAIFVLQVAIWAARNLALFWDGTASGLLWQWQTSDYNSHSLDAAVADPGLFVVGFLGKLPLLFVGVVSPLWPYWPSIRDHVRTHWREEAVTGLLLAAFLVFFLGAVFAGVYWVTERTDFLWMNNMRYATPALAPLLWLFLRDETAAAKWIPWAWFYGFSLVEIGISRVLLSH